MRLFKRLFHKPIHKDKTENNRGICRILAPSVVSIFLCAVCLCGVSWAWFTASVSTGSAVIESPSYSISYQVGSGEATAISGEAAFYEMEAASCVVTLKALGTNGATGYCGIEIGESIYYTEQITAEGTLSFTVNAPVGTKIKLVPGWGSCAVRTEENKIADGGVVNIDTPAVTAENTLPANANENENNIIAPQQDESETGDALTPSDEETGTQQGEADTQDSTEVSGGISDTTESFGDIPDTTEPTTESTEFAETEGTEVTD